MKKILLPVLSILLFSSLCFSQTKEEMEAQKAELDKQIAELSGQLDPIKAESDALAAKIEALQIWRKGTYGTIGANLTNFSNWVTAPNINSQTTTISGNFGGFINKKTDSHFWNNTATLNVGWQKLDLDTEVDEIDEAGFERIADILNINSLFGYKISEKIAISAMGDLRVNVLDKLSDTDPEPKKPTYLDIGTGITYLPINNMTITAHPLSYNFVFADEALEYDSSLGAKIVVDYSTELVKGLQWRSNLSSFFSYSETSDLSNWTFTNGFTFSVWKGIGVGIDMAIKNNKQETRGLESDSQKYFIFGLSYAL